MCIAHCQHQDGQGCPDPNTKPHPNANVDCQDWEGRGERVENKGRRGATCLIYDTIHVSHKDVPHIYGTINWLNM